MKKPTFLLLLSLACLTLHSFSQVPETTLSGGTARTAALGGGPYHPFLKDYSDVFVNPAYSLTYSDLFYGDLGYNFAAFRASGQFLGWTMAVGDFAVGLLLGRREGPMFSENAYGTGTLAASDYMKTALDTWLAGRGFTASTEPLSPLQGYAAFSVGDTKVGFALYVARWNRTDDGSGNVGTRQFLQTSNNQFGFKGGVVTEVDPSLELDVSALVRFNTSSADYSDGNPGANPASASFKSTGTEFGLNARSFLELSPKLTLVPAARYFAFGHTPDLVLSPAATTPNPNPNKFSKSEVELGIGLQSSSPSGLVLASLSFQSITLKNDISSVSGSTLQTTKYSQTWIDLPKVQLGAELRFAGWGIGRFGYFKRFSSSTFTTEFPSGQTTEVSSTQEMGYVPNLGLTSGDQQLSLGLGLVFDRLAIDGYVGERFLAAGPWFISGNAQNLFGLMSVSFRF